MNRKYYKTSIEHLMAELERIDLLISTFVGRARRLFVSDQQFQGLYISEQEIEQLLSHPAGLPKWAFDKDQLNADGFKNRLDQLSIEINTQKRISLETGIELRLEKIEKIFGLKPVEIDILLICLIPEMDTRYEKIFAYLQDDVTQKRPSIDLVLNILSNSFEDKLKLRKLFLKNAPLSKYFLITHFEDNAIKHPSFVTNHLKLNDRIADFLLNHDHLDFELTPFTSLIKINNSNKNYPLPESIDKHLSLFSVHLNKVQDSNLINVIKNNEFETKSIILKLCELLNTNLIIIDMEKVLSFGKDFIETSFALLEREAKLQQSAIFIKNFDKLNNENVNFQKALVLKEIGQWDSIVFLSYEFSLESESLVSSRNIYRMDFSDFDIDHKSVFWEETLTNFDIQLQAEETKNISSKFKLSYSQIKKAIKTAKNISIWKNPSNNNVTVNDLYEACRIHSNQKLTQLAQKISPNYTWNDIILPEDKIQQLIELCNYVKYKSLVFNQWGFEKKLSLGKGLNALFSGPSGTGKTMAAEIISNELGLDLYKIDLSALISKYIGETEKNLKRIFIEAESSNSIIFFDEADAIFGKRSQVKDSHDRYANIEISYLLQKMEEYRGVVILATNLRKNMDDAFVRRMHFTIDFPFPGFFERLRIWEQIWPDNLPKNSNLDLALMARQLEIPGGNIKNIALSAAFLAASDGQVVEMMHLAQAAKREFQKMGKTNLLGNLELHLNHGPNQNTLN